jgi:hypothetical protein
MSYVLTVYLIVLVEAMEKTVLTTSDNSNDSDIYNCKTGSLVSIGNSLPLNGMISHEIKCNKSSWK